MRKLAHRHLEGASARNWRWCSGRPPCAPAWRRTGTCSTSSRGGSPGTGICHLASRAQPELPQPINDGLPEATWTRYHELQAKRDAETLTPGGHAGLIRLVNKVEIWNARRLEAVAELARLRGVRFPDLVPELGTGAQRHKGRRRVADCP